MPPRRSAEPVPDAPALSVGASEEPDGARPAPEDDMRVTGTGGLLRHGYQTAARLGSWALVREGDTVTVTAPVTDADTYWLGQAPLDLRLHMGGRVWAWPDVQVTFQDGGSSLTLVTHGSPLVL